MVAPVTGNVSWIGDSEPTSEDLATELGKVYQVWNRVREKNSQTWVSRNDNDNDEVEITIMVEPDNAQVHILCPADLGYHHVLGVDAGGILNDLRARLCVGAIDDGEVCLHHVEMLCRAIVTLDSIEGASCLDNKMVRCAGFVLKHLDALWGVERVERVEEFEDTVESGDYE